MQPRSIAMASDDSSDSDSESRRRRNANASAMQRICALSTKGRAGMMEALGLAPMPPGSLTESDPSGAHAAPAAGPAATAGTSHFAAKSAPAASRRAQTQRVAATRANQALLAEPQRSNNYPPADAAEAGEEACKQIYRPDLWEYGLQTNCRLLGTVVQLSDMLPNGEAGLGLFATRRFEEGEIVGYLWGKFVAQEEWDSIKIRGFDPSHRGAEEDYATPVKQGIHRVVSVELQDNGASLLLASQQCPMAYINQGHGPQTNNVDIVFPDDPFDDTVHPAYTYIRFVVKTSDGAGVAPGEEFTTSYGWSPKALNDLKSLYVAHLTQLSKARPGQLRQYDSIRAQHSASVGFGIGGSSVVSEGSSSSSSSAESHRRRAALEQVGDRLYHHGGQLPSDAAIPYRCCKMLCHMQVSRSWVINVRNAWAGLSKEGRHAVAERLCTSDRTRKSGNDPQNERWAHSYTVWLEKLGKVRVCQRFWSDVYQVDPNWHSRRVEKQFQETRNRTDFKTQSVVRWLEEMQKMHEHMPDTVGAGRDSAAAASRPRQTGVLISFAHKKDVYNEYVKDMREECSKLSRACGARELHMDGTGYVAGKSVFMQTWKERFKHIKLRKSSRFAKCDTCVELRGFLHDPAHRHMKDKMKEAGEKLQAHLLDIKTERAEYHRKRREAVKEPNKYLSIILDGADQGSYGYPHFKEHTKTDSGCWKQKYHLIGALAHGRGTWVYTMSHRFPADPNVTIEVLQRVLTDLSNESGGPLPETLYLQLDNCGRENKNAAVMAYIGWLVNRKIFASVEVSFLPVGHTHEDIDQVWSRTGLQMRGNDVTCEAELFNIIKEGFHHYGYSARCGSLDDDRGVANIKGWLLSYCEEMSGLAQREVMHLRFEMHDDGPCIKTKNRATQEFNYHVYKTASKGFHQLRKGIPSPPFAEGTARPPPLQPKVMEKKKHDKMMKTLLTWRYDDRVSGQAYEWLRNSMVRLAHTAEVPFSWPHDGQLLCERTTDLDQLNAIDMSLPYVSSDQMHRRAQADQDAEEEAEEIAQRADAEEENRDDDDSDSDAEDAVPLGLRTAEDEKRRVAQEQAAEDEANFVVDVMQTGHFVMYIPREEERKPQIGAGKRDARTFWVGQVYADWEEDGVHRHGVNRQTGLITVHNYTPYNVKNGMASSNNVASEYGYYMPEYDSENKEKWFDVQWENVLCTCTTLRHDGNNPLVIGPLAPSYFQLPKYIKKRLQGVFERAERRPVRTLLDYELTGVHSKGKRARSPKISERSAAKMAIDQLVDNEDDDDSSADDDDDDHDDDDDLKDSKRRRKVLNKKAPAARKVAAPALGARKNPSRSRKK